MCASCLAPALFCYGKRRGNTRVKEQEGREGDRTTTNEQMRQNHPVQPRDRAKTFTSFDPLSCLLQTPQRAKNTRRIPPPCGHFGEHSSGSLLQQRMPHCERSSVLNTHLSPAEDSLSSDRCQNTAESFYILKPCSIVAWQKRAL